MKTPPFTASQNEMIDFTLGQKMGASAWFASPGYGKTLPTLEVIANTQGSTLVVAPLAVCLTTWPDEIDEWGYGFTQKLIHGRNFGLDDLEQVNLINYEGLVKLADLIWDQRRSRAFPFKHVVYDELSRMKNVRSKRFKKWSRFTSKIDYTLGLTGTPVGNKMHDLFGEISILDNYRALGRFGGNTAIQRFEAFFSRFFIQNSKSYKITPRPGAKQAILKMIKDIAISYDIEDLDMPPIKHNPIRLRLPEAATEYYQQMARESVIPELDVVAVNAAVKSGKSRQIASGSVFNADRELKRIHNVKGEMLADLAHELDGEPLMIFFEFRHDYEAICDALKCRVPAIAGFTPSKDVAKLTRQWNEGKLDFLALHPVSAGYGLNLQKRGHHMCFYTLPWSLELVIQSIGRLWRRGQGNKVFVHYLLIKNTEDERVFDVVRDKRDLHDEVMKALKGSNR